MVHRETTFITHGSRVGYGALGSVNRTKYVYVTETHLKRILLLLHLHEAETFSVCWGDALRCDLEI